MTQEGPNEGIAPSISTSTQKSVLSTKPSDLINALLSLLSSPRPIDFYDVYARLIGGLCQAQFAIVLQLKEAGFQRLGGTEGAKEIDWLEHNFKKDRLAACLEQGYSYEFVRNPDGLGSLLVAVRLVDVVDAVAMISLPERDRSHLKEAVIRMMLVKNLVLSASENQRSGASDLLQDNQRNWQSKQTAGMAPAAPHLGTESSILNWLDLAADVMNCRRFSAAALSIVNGVAARFTLRQVALVWRSAAKARLIAVSHLERFESNSPLVHSLEQAAQEVLATDALVSVCTIETGTQSASIGIAHLALMERMPGVRRITSLPIRNNAGQTQAVLVMAANVADGIPEHSNLSLTLELCLSWLIELDRRQQYWWQRAGEWIGGKLQIVFGPGAYGVKLASLISLSLLITLYAVELPYHVDASAQITTDNTRVITAQVEGRLKEVYADVGDLVAGGQIMALLDVTDLQQQRAEVQSDIEKYLAEEDKARASGNLAELLVARTRREQSLSRVKRIEYQLQQAETKAPFAGVVVEGEKRELSGSTVRRGDKLYRIAEVRDLYVVLQVPERDLREIRMASQGELRLLGEPGKTIPFAISNFVPMAQVKGEEGNHFLLKAKFTEQTASWWRPGMTGLAKIEVGPRNLFWILFHPTVDRIRLWLWL